MKKVWLMVGVALLVYTIVDIWIWRYVFEIEYRYQNVLANDVARYQWTWQLILMGLISVGSMALWPDKTKVAVFVFSTLTLAHSGLEDILYYWLDLRAVPISLPWLNNATLILGIRPVTSFGLFLSAGIWLAFWISMGWIVQQKQTTLNAG